MNSRTMLFLVTGLLLELGASLYRSNNVTHAQTPAVLTTLADITGDGNVHQLQTTGLAHYVNFTTPVTGNTGTCRIAESAAAVTSTRGWRLAPNSNVYLATLGGPYALSSLYYSCTSSDVMSVEWAY